jgi:Bacterial Ig domain
VPAAAASHGGGGKSSCTQNAPGVAVQSNYQWGQWGSWGLPGQQLTYLIDVINYDVGCGSSTFTVNISAPGGFTPSPATSTVSLKSGASAYVWAYVTSPSAIADGNYPLTVSVSRTGASTAASTGSFVSYYKVYSSDSVAPTLYWPNPGDGTTITGRSYNVAVSASDDHAVKTIDLYIDGVYKSGTLCDDHRVHVLPQLQLGDLERRAYRHVQGHRLDGQHQPPDGQLYRQLVGPTERRDNTRGAG